MSDWSSRAKVSALRGLRTPVVRTAAFTAFACVIVLLLVYRTAQRTMIDHLLSLDRMQLDDLRSGDLVIFGSIQNPKQLVIQFLQHAHASHVGLVVRLEQPYLWHITSGRAPTLEPLSGYLGRMHRGDYCLIRQINRPVDEGELARVMGELRDHRYSLTCISHALRRIWKPFRPAGGRGRSGRRLYCSQLVAETYARLGLLTGPPPEQLMPVDVCDCNRGLPFRPGVHLSVERRLAIA